MHTLHIHGKDIHTIEELYEEVLRQLPEKREYFGYNLDALFDILSDWDVDRIILHGSHYLKKALDHVTPGRKKEEMTIYYHLLDILTDLSHVDVILQDD